MIAHAGRVVFPGQGAMPDCMRELDARGLRDAVLEAARNKPFLGICIGLQMLFEHSAEGDVPGLGMLRGEVLRFASDMHDAQGNKLKVPHMGWNQVHHGEHTSVGRHRAGCAFLFCAQLLCAAERREPGAGDQRLSATFRVCGGARQFVCGAVSPGKEPCGRACKLLQNFIHWNP